MEKLTDKSPMPFGKHKGRLLGNVPAKDLLWLFDNGKAGRVTPYIVENMACLKAEAYPKKRK